MQRILRMASPVWLFPLLLTVGHAPAFGQVNLAGVWNNLQILHEDEPERLPGPELGDYLGVPINAAARYRADAWDASLITLPEYQCRVHPSDYVPSFAGMRMLHAIAKTVGSGVAIWPFERPAPVVTSDAGTAISSAYHWFGVLLFSRSSCTLCCPPWESEIGTWML